MYIDVNDVLDLHRIAKESDRLIIGANITLTTFLAACKHHMNDRGFRYLKQMAKHIDLVASLPIRNVTF